ncbi:MAG: hypothetical protein LBD37_07115 [Treponema sp.]|jgi:hypothetical protein|nr:hypothetical protein [Treponema sp.]
MAGTVKRYETGVTINRELRCAKCAAALTPRPVLLSYMNSSFPVELPACPTCGYIFIPEDLATGRILYVERALEDK